MEKLITREKLKNRADNRKLAAATAMEIPQGLYNVFPFKDQSLEVHYSANKAKCPSSFFKKKIILGNHSLPTFSMHELRHILMHSSVRTECTTQIKAGI